MNEPPDPEARAALVREVWIASIGILVALGAIKHLGASVPLIRSYGFTIALGLQLYVPLLLRGKHGITTEGLGLTFRAWKTDLVWLGAWSLIVTVPFVVGHHYWQTVVMGRPFAPAVPDELFQRLILTTVVVALAEELYFRGYLQERLQRLWPARRKLFGVPFGAAIIVSSLVFALAHFVGEYRLTRLAPFFPSLLFGLMRARSGTIVGAAAFHAYCNVLGDFVWASYR